MDPMGAQPMRNVAASGQGRVRFVAYVRAADRPGSLTAVAEVVSGRGVSVEFFVSGERRGSSVLLIFVFAASPRLHGQIQRTLMGLSGVESVTMVPADSPEVLAAGVVHTRPGHRFVPPPETAVTWSGDTSQDQPLLVEGTLADVEAVLAAARREGAVLVCSMLLPP
ncbi:hypothetical protein [Micropruina sp.]|uniref:hypothetical protein n=1 Tax=Micropruina sp. TaxID=2737536 RepID=UPI0039E3E2BA